MPLIHKGFKLILWGRTPELVMSFSSKVFISLTFLVLLKHFSMQKYCNVQTQEKSHRNVYAGHYDQCGTIF